MVINLTISVYVLSKQARFIHFHAKLNNKTVTLVHVWFFIRIHEPTSPSHQKLILLPLGKPPILV